MSEPRTTSPASPSSSSQQGSSPEHRRRGARLATATGVAALTSMLLLASPALPWGGIVRWLAVAAFFAASVLVNRAVTALRTPGTELDHRVASIIRLGSFTLLLLGMLLLVPSGSAVPLAAAVLVPVVAFLPLALVAARIARGGTQAGLD